MQYIEKIKVAFKDTCKDNLVENTAILEYLENIAGRHADSLGDGAKDMGKNGTGWILLDWKVNVLHRPVYGDELTVKTWSRGFERCYGNRDFEICDSSGRLCVIASSRWLLVDTQKWTITRAEPDVIEKYLSEPERRAYPEDVLKKMKAPEKFSHTMPYKVMRRDIDNFGHMHNTYYLSLAYEVLPEDIYALVPFDDIRITYKKEIKPGETVLLNYAFADGKHTVVITSEDGKAVHSIIEMV